MTASTRREVALVADASAKSCVAVLESCARMGLYVIAASNYPYACGFYSRATRERAVYPNPEHEPEACLRFLVDLLRRRGVSVIFPLGHHMVAFVAKHQDSLRQYARIVLPPYDVFLKGLDKIPTLKAAAAVRCPIPTTWYPLEEPLDQIARSATYPVLIKPAIGVGARGLTYCHTREELLAKFPNVEAAHGRCFVQEFIPQTGLQHKCAFVLDYSQNVLAAMVYAKLRYYPVSGGSSTLNKSVDHPFIRDHSVRVAQHIKWVGACDMDWITDPRDNTPKLMEINPRFTDTFKMTALVGFDLTRMIYQLGKGETPAPQLQYKTDKYLRFLAGDIMWFLASPRERWSARPSFFDFFRSDTSYLMTGTRDWGPVMGYLLQNASILWDKKEREFRLRRQNA